MSTRHVDIRVFAEGVRIPALSVTRSQSRMGGMTFSVGIPPTPVGFGVLPGTLIHVFVKRRQEGDDGEKRESFVLFAEGRVRGRNASIERGGSRSLILECASLDAEWQYIPMGFDIGFDTSFPRPRLKAFFHGLSPSVYEQDYIPRLTQVMNYQVYRVLSGGRNSSLDPFFDLKSVVYDMIRNQGPALGIAQTIAMMPRIHPLERQSMMATRFYKRLVAIENSAFTQHLANEKNYESLKGRIDAMSPQKTTLRQMIDTILPTTYHHQFTLGSPWFNKALYDSAESEGVVEESEHEEIEEEASGSERDVLPVAEPFDARSADMQKNVWPSTNYKESDFDCKPGTIWYQKVPTSLKANVKKLAQNLDNIVRHAGGKPHINSAYRSERYNKRVRGVRNSQHRLGRAVDLRPPSGMTAPELYLLLNTLMDNGLIDRGGLGLYRTFVHYDIRGSKASWLAGGGDALTYARQVTGITGDSISAEGMARTASNVNQQDEWEASAQAGVLPSMIIKPNMHFAPPPVSNVFFGDQVSSAQVGEGFDHSFSRMMMVAPSMLQKLVESGNPLAAMFVPLYFIPNHMQGIVDKMTDSPNYSDIRLTGIDDESKMDQTASANRALVSAQMKAALNAIPSTMQNPLLGSSTLSDEQETNGMRDALTHIINREDVSIPELPEALMGIYTYEELFKGVRPVVSRLPYMQQSTDPEEWVAIYGHYTFAMLARQARLTRLAMPLNLNVAVGFSGAFHDHSMGWVLGEVETVQDVIDAGGSATTTIQMGGCAFYGDLDNPSWARMYNDNQGAFDNYSRPGEQTPTLFDDAFAPGAIGASIYKGVLGVGSVIDQAQTLSGRSGLTMKEALDVLHTRYSEAESSTTWVESQFVRRIVTEGEMMQYILEAGPEQASEGPVADQLHERYTGTYAAHAWPDKASFVTERRHWAEDYRRDLEVRDSALDVINPTDDNYAAKEAKLPHEDATADYNTQLPNRGNATPKTDFLS